MRIIEGFVCVATVKWSIRQQVLFGWPIKEESFEQGHESFQSNGMTPFPFFLAAVLAKDSLQRRQDLQLQKVSIAKIEMALAESRDEWESPNFRQAGRWIVDFKGDLKQDLLIGQLVHKSQARAVPGEDLSTNNMRPFTSWESVRYALSEWQRQGASRAYISTFSLRTLG